MKHVSPNKITIYASENRSTRQVVDGMVARVVNKANRVAPLSLVLERFVVFFAAQTVFEMGKEGAIASLQALIQDIEDGGFDHLTEIKRQHHSHH